MSQSKRWSAVGVAGVSDLRGQSIVTRAPRLVRGAYPKAFSTAASGPLFSVSKEPIRLPEVRS